MVIYEEIDLWCCRPGFNHGKFLLLWCLKESGNNYVHRDMFQ